MELEGSVDSSSASLPYPPLNNTRRSRRSDAEKLDMVCNYMRTELRWGVSEFTKALALSGGPANARRKAAFAATAYKDSEVLKSHFGNIGQLQDGGRLPIIETLDLGNNELRKEVEKLGTIEPFNKYDPTSKSGEFEVLDMDQTLHIIQSQAPLLLQLIRDIMAPKHGRTYQRQSEPVARIITIISILCFSQRQNSSTSFQTNLGLYLHSNGVKRRQIELLSRLGLIVSYDTIIRIIKEQSAWAAEEVKDIGQGNGSVTAYDNFEVMDGVKEQRVDHQGTFHSVTTGQVIQGIEMPPGGIRQDMIDQQAKLCSSDVFLAPGNRDDDIRHQVGISCHVPGLIVTINHLK